MPRLLVLVLLLAGAASADRVIVAFRLKKDPRATVRGWALEVTEEGMRVERIGGVRRFFVPWDDLVDEDQSRLRRRFRLEVSEDERLGLCSGHRLHFKGGGSADGVLEWVDDDGRHWLRREDFLLPYPPDRIARVEEVKVKETDVFDPEELYVRRLQRTPPRTAEQHRLLGDHLCAAGNLEKAAFHYREARRLKPAWHATIRARLDEIERLMADAVAYAILKRARAAYRLRKDFDAAHALVERFAREHPDRQRAALQLRDEIEAARVEEARKRFTAVKNDEFRRVVERFLRTRPELEAALSWVRARARKEVLAGLESRLGLARGQVETFLEDPPLGATHWCTYGSGSFIFSRRAEKGPATRKAVRGDPDAWWDAHADLETRASLLRAYAAERLPELFEVVQVKLTDCAGCGGTGQVRHTSVRPLPDGRHEWKQVCPRCFKARWDRAVGYR